MSLTIFAALAAMLLCVAAVIYHYRPKGRPLPATLQVGNTLPAFNAVNEAGEPLSSSNLRGTATVMLFVRGNWCPFCSRQVANLTKYYKEINDRGARVILVTPKPLETTRRVARFFDVDFEFWLDEDLAIADQLGLRQLGAVPKNQRKEYGEDSFWPAAIVMDPDGKIRYASISKIIADRPDPKKFLQVIDTMA